jgi:hypothetical protein
MGGMAEKLERDRLRRFVWFGNANRKTALFIIFEPAETKLLSDPRKNFRRMRKKGGLRGLKTFRIKKMSYIMGKIK